MSDKKIVKIWRGKRATYEKLVNNGETDYWTHYYVKDEHGMWSEYFGNIPIKEGTGQLKPVNTIVSALPETLYEGDRYLVGHDASENQGAEYYVVEIASIVDKSIIQPLGSLSVRVKDRNLYSYQVVNGKLTTYDGDIICGTF